MNNYHLNPWDFGLIPFEKREKENLNICGGRLHKQVDCANDEAMQKVQIRKPLISINFSIFEKTAPEKEAAKKVKKEFINHSFEKKNEKTKTFLYPKRLVVYLKNEKRSKDFKTTMSFTINSINELNGILFDGVFFKKTLVQRVFLDNKVYKI